MEVVGNASDGLEAIELVRRTAPDVVLLDLLMPNLDGLGALTTILSENPSARVLILTNFADDEKVFAAIQGGARGYLLKDSNSDELIHAIHEVYRGESYLHPVVARKVMRKMTRPSKPVGGTHALTRRETEVLNLLAKGQSNKEIAANLAVSEHTINAHVGSILRKLNLTNRTQAALYALNEGRDSA
jgi:NarL family two-component system response regulator LiaR